MKKGIIVLLIAVLVAGFAFADGKLGDVTFAGSAEIGYEFNLDAKNHGIYNDNSAALSFTFEFATADAESKGEGKVYAEIAGEASASFELDEAADGDVIVPEVAAEITKANIVAGDLVIDILGPKGAFDYASIYIKDKKGKPIVNFANAYKIDDHGFVVSYKDFSFAFAFYNHAVAEEAEDATFVLNEPTADNENAYWVEEDPGTGAFAYKYIDLYAGVQTPKFKLADGLTVQAGANFAFVKFDDEIPVLELFNTLTVGGGAKVEYKPEDSKLSAYFGADAQYFDLLEWDDGTLIPVDIAAGAKYDFVSADVYFGTANKFEEGTNVLAGKVSAAYPVNDQIKVSGAAEAYWNRMRENTKPILSFSAGVDYKADSLAAYVKGEVTMQNGADGYELKKWTYPDGKGTTIRRGLGISAGVSSTAIINNATVGLDWSKADFSEKDADDKLTKLGVVKAYISVEF